MIGLLFFLNIEVFAVARISILKPTDQPLNQKRLLNELKQCLGRNDLNNFKFVVAYAKSGPLKRLESDIQNWLHKGKSIEAVFGIDQRNTSQEALEFALDNFTQSYIAHVKGRFDPTFHPKLYLFSGRDKAMAFIGSNNLTVGGTEINFETGVKFDLELPADQDIFNEVQQCWIDAQNISLLLTRTLLNQLVASGSVRPESQMQRRTTGISRPGSTSTTSIPTFSQFNVIPPSSIPRSSSVTQSTTGPTRQRTLPTKKRSRSSSTSTDFSSATTFVIQIKPERNGEIRLSYVAVKQNPDFFGWPFTGWTVPTYPTNPPYPQRLPDPIVNISVFDNSGSIVIWHENFGLNTVDYERRSEIRITVPPDVIDHTPDRSILLMSIPEDTLDYQLDIYPPKSPQYHDLLAACNQTMPSGGRPDPRRFGWI